MQLIPHASAPIAEELMLARAERCYSSNINIRTLLLFVVSTTCGIISNFCYRVFSVLIALYFIVSYCIVFIVLGFIVSFCNVFIVLSFIVLCCIIF